MLNFSYFEGFPYKVGKKSYVRLSELLKEIWINTGADDDVVQILMDSNILLAFRSQANFTTQIQA